MTTDTRKASVVIGLALALVVSVAAQAADGQAADGSLAPKAVAFVRMLAKGDYKAAEADFTDEMQQAAPPEKLSGLWQSLVIQFGPFQDTGNSKTVAQSGYTTVVVRTDFKHRALGIAVSFDSAQRIAGMHLVPPP